MQTILFPKPQDWPTLMQRPGASGVALEKPVRKILADVRKNGDKALRRYTRLFDGINLKFPEVTRKEWAAAEQAVEPSLKSAINQAIENITLFHQAQLETPVIIETVPGVQCWRRPVGIGKVGLYVPGGSAPLFSTVLMLAIPAQLARCPEIILCSPPGKDGKLHPAILYAAQRCGVSRVFKLGGVQAIGALAYGTESVPWVQKIFGPGNPYVTIAKQLVQQEGVAIDMPAGPSELLVVADESAKPAYVAADLLSQAEHGPDSQVILLSDSESFCRQVTEEIIQQLELLPRRDITARALENSKMIVLKDTREALSFSNSYAPEHLILACRNAVALSMEVTSAGSVFIGDYSPESAGDYASGTNHTLPTNGYAAMYSGVSVDSFVKKISFQQLSREGLGRIAASVMEMAAAEGLEAHRNAVAVRLNNEL